MSYKWEVHQNIFKNKAHRCSLFIRDHQQKGDICIESVGTEDQLTNMFTKPLDEKRFCKLRNELNILGFSNMC